MTPPKKTSKKKEKLSQYNASFSMHYDIILRELIDYFYNKGIIDSDSKYGLANFSILRMLFDYVDVVIPDYPYTAEQLVALIEEHEKLKNKFEEKLIAMTTEKDEKMEKVMSEIDVES